MQDISVQRPLFLTRKCSFMSTIFKYIYLMDINPPQKMFKMLPHISRVKDTASVNTDIGILLPPLRLLYLS